MRSLLAALCLVLAACGPTPQEIATAKSAHYAGTAAQVLDAALEVAEHDYKIAEVDQIGRRFSTRAQMYSAEGDRESPGADNVTQFRDRSVLVSLIVTVVPLADEHEYAVTVTPHTLQMLSGTPQPRELREDDPNLPPWIHGRVDALSLAIYERLKSSVR